MKRTVLLVIAGLCLSIAAYAQEPGRPIAYVNTGLVRPLSPDDFHANWVAGFNIGFGAGTRLNPRLELRGMVTYNNFTLSDRNFMTDQQLADAYTMVDGGDRNIWTFFAEVKSLHPTRLNTKVTPYVVLGAGVMHIVKKEIKATLEDSEMVFPGGKQTAAGAELGIGFDAPMDEHTTIYLELKFQAGFTDEKTTVFLPIEIGVAIH